MLNKQSMWMVRAGEDAYLAEEFLSKGLVAIGWNRVGDLTNLKDLESLKIKLSTTFPEFKTGKINNVAGQIFRFRFEFAKNQKVVTYNNVTRIYHIGEITSDYYYSSNLTDYHHIRYVKWISSVGRDDLSTAAKNSLGAIMTLFKLPDFLQEELLHQKPTPAPTFSSNTADEETVETLDTLKEDI
ncbi:restriction endonuclease [Rufibacter tibetensis]|uniref:restriction endonuclease n=1 Tax=Rufibacter tibetensis TaxID=512763 RepID=UPI0007809916|nr:hypothetical protein [Rufibacter tibetensis]